MKDGMVRAILWVSRAIRSPLNAEFFSIVDAFDAMTNDRPYSKARNRQEAIDEIKRCSGTQFDPELVIKFREMIEIESF